MALCADAGGLYPVPRFTDPQRATKLAAAFPEIDAIFRDYAALNKLPGIAWGIVVDGALAHLGVEGVQDLANHQPVTASTAFRIASMTKSVTALAILKLRDAGKLSLEDPVSRWIPEFGSMRLPTRDSAPLRIRQLLSHSSGFPEDNPWGDQQLAVGDAELTAWLRRGIPFSTAPATRYEYSNYAYGLLGRIVGKAAGVPYEQYVRGELLRKLRMNAATFEFSQVPRAERAVGYRLQPNGAYLEEPPLPHGAFGAMGGLITNSNDLARYVAFHLAAWPARDDADDGPVRRSSVREMAHLWTPSNLTVKRVDGKLQAAETGYGYGLRATTDCRFEHIVAHGGGLPGFGSYMAWLPDYGVGMFAMTNLTYAGPSEAIGHAWDALLRTGALQPRELPASPMLREAQDHILHLWKSWDDAEAQQVAAVNLFRDESIADRRAAIERLQQQMGACGSAGPLRAENWLRGQFNLACANGTVGVFFTLSPTQPPAVQYLSFRKLDSTDERLGAPTGAPAGVACSE